MKKILKFSVIPLLLAAIFAIDIALTRTNFIKNSNIFVKNDFEITQFDHPEKIWDKVFFGNSVVIASYIEEDSSSGYINLGLDYGVADDLWQLLKNGYIHVGSELVIGLNYLTLYDEFDTNPTYIWHKKPYQPYVYFERDRFYPLITGCFNRFLNGESVPPMTYSYQRKAVYHGRVAKDALEEKYKEYESLYFDQPIEKFSKNISRLSDIAGYCRRHNIRLRAVWMPWNPDFEVPQLVKDVRAQADLVLQKEGVQTLDLENKLGAEMFYDTGHLNYDVGAERFTAMLDKWL